LESERVGALSEPVESAAAGEARAVAVLVALLGLGLVDNQVLAPLLPDIARALDTTSGWVGRTASGYAVAAAAAGLVVGPLSDRAGRRRFLVAAAVVLGFAGALVFFTPGFSGFALARVVAGAGAGAVSALAVASIADAVPYQRRGRAMGWVATAYFAAPILGVPVAAWVADASGWRTNYAAFAVLGCVCALAVHAWFEEGPPAPAPEARRKSYLAFLRTRSTALGAVSAFFVTGGLTGFLLFLGAFLREEVGLTLTGVGHVFLLCGVASLAGALGAGRLADRMGKLPVALGGSVALSLFLLLVPRTEGVALYGMLGLVGLAAAARVAPLQSVVTELVPSEERGAYVALRNTLSQLGSATAALVAAALYHRGFEYVCWLTALFSITAFALLLGIEEPRKES
jgi:predicted MFS family arabinose efflux permease